MAWPSKKSSIMKIGAIYARHSSRFQHSIEAQVRVCKEWAEKNGITVPNDLIFSDRAVTGKSSRRKFATSRSPSRRPPLMFRTLTKACYTAPCRNLIVFESSRSSPKRKRGM